jgi:DNA adenine methylase
MRMVNSTRKDCAKPFIKWAGGKSQVLSEIRAKYPPELGKKIKKYVEPFVGGGAILFDILNDYSLDEIYISDINRELIYTYVTLRDNPFDLVEILQKIEAEYLAANEKTRKNIFYNNREKFNILKLEDGTSVELAALFVFLNRTCFNGLYRVNSSGGYNVPQGRYRNPCICDEQNLKKVSSKLQGVTMVHGDYRLAENFIDEKTFAYFDPPYRPLSTTANFTSYTQDGFDDNAQAELASFIDKMTERGAYVLASNSDPKNTDANDNFFDNLYANHNILRIEASRAINSAGSCRGRIRELLIANRSKAPTLARGN